MMANATRDPLWRAEVSVEMAATPALARQISTKCMSCHAPMAERDPASQGAPLSVEDLSGTDRRAHLALDGVSCTACHQLEPSPNVEATFNGGYRFNSRREIYGPHDAPYAQPMSLRTGFVPVQGNHILESSNCASCHTLYTQAVRADGTPTGGQIAEQTPYLEWRNSEYSTERTNPGAGARSCQDCHTPSDDEDGNPIQTRLARDGQGDFPIAPRSPFGRHVFLGGNTLIPQLLRDHRNDLHPLAPDAALNAVIEATRRQLKERTARVVLTAMNRVGNLLQISARAENQTGHKFPTGHPTRRAWLHMRVANRAGRVVFESGRPDGEGRILDAQGALLPSEAAGGPTQPHYTRITQSGQVQIYQALMKDEANRVTFLLLRGEGYAKDNRLLPRGWTDAGPNASDTAPQGVGADADFLGGSDTVIYQVEAPSEDGPYAIELRLLYQPLSSRFAEELFRYRTPEVDAFKSYYRAADRRAEEVSTARSSVP